MATMVLRGHFPNAEIVLRSLVDEAIVWKIIADKVEYETKNDGCIITFRVTCRPVQKVKEEPTEADGDHEMERRETMTSSTDFPGSEQSTVIDGKNNHHHDDAGGAGVRRKRGRGASKEIELNEKEETIKKNKNSSFSSTSTSSSANHHTSGRHNAQEPSKKHNAGSTRSVSARHKSRPARRCAVPGCRNFSQGRVLAKDFFGDPGQRCFRHGGGNRCSVPMCQSSNQGRVSVKDVFGEPGQRCVRHGGGSRCSVENCKNSSQGKVLKEDAWGAPGRRCCSHGASKIKGIS